MKIAVLSDIHDHVWNLAYVLSFCKNSDAMILCGDLCSPFIISQLGDGFKGPIHIIFGNNDADTFRMTRLASRHPQIHLHSELLQDELGGLKFCANHYPDIASGLARSGLYNVVCYGHDHVYAMQKQDDVFLLNPGTIMGYNPVQGVNVRPSFILFDTNLIQANGYLLVESGECKLASTCK